MAGKTQIYIYFLKWRKLLYKTHSEHIISSLFQKKRCFILCPVFEIKSSGISNLLYRMLQQLKMKVLLAAKLMYYKTDIHQLPC